MHYDSSALARFWAKVNVGESDDWWEWQAGLRRGYGQFWTGIKEDTANRFSYEIYYGPIPEGGYICHTCDNRLCVNPRHLFVGTNRENQLDKVAKGRQAYGENHGRALLGPAEVRQIRQMYATGKWSQHKLAERFGVSRAAIEKIVSRKTWRHLE